MRFVPLSAAIVTLFLLNTLPAAQAQTAHQHEHDHKHDTPAAAESKESDEDHDHHHEAPHGGTLIVIGDHSAHVELLLDPAEGRLTGYVLDAEAENAIRIAQPEIKLQIEGSDVTSSATVTLKPVASPLTGEKAGDTSQFEATSAALKGKNKFTVTIEDITIKGQNFKHTKSPFPEGNH